MQKHLPQQVKPAVLILVFLFDAKIPSNCDETAAAAAFTLISLATATHAAASSSSVISKDSPQQLLPAFVTTNRKLSGDVTLRWTENT